MTRKKNNTTPILSLKNPWENNSNAIWLGSSLSFCRNLDRYKFPAKLSSDERSQVISLVEQAFEKGAVTSNPVFCQSDQITPLEKEFLGEHFLSVTGFLHAHSGEAFVIDDTGEFLAVVNIGDHLILQLFDSKGDLSDALNRLIEVETKLSENVALTFSDQFGYLTASPHSCGTGLFAMAYLQLPALIYSKKLPELLEQLRQDGLVITGLQGSPDEFLGDILRLENRYTIGLDEDKIVFMVATAASRLSSEEQNTRKELRAGNAPDIKDSVSRAFGLLTHSYQLETVEAINALSLLKLGVDLGWVEKVTIVLLNELLFSCRRASLTVRMDTEVDQELLPKVRAEFLREELKDMALKIEPSV
jgi:protein arginine kinase